MFSIRNQQSPLGIWLSLFLSIIFIPNSVFAEILWRKQLGKEELQEAQKSNKLILLNLEAVWCHWCHVMKEKTYSDARVEKLLEEKFLSIKIDQDSRPDLSGRYQEYGWPATIILNASGEDLRKLAGFINPDDFLETLEGALKNPSPTTSSEKVRYAEEGKLDEALKVDLLKRHDAAQDRALGGLKTVHKYIERDTVEYLLTQASRGDSVAQAQAYKTLLAAESLLDPVWGGVYQYSVHGVWNKPHYEKLLLNQADYIRLYALAARLSSDQTLRDRLLKNAYEILRYADTFLKAPDGTYYTSQDADVEPGKESSEYRKLGDQERRARGIPRIDTNVYSDRNGHMIRGLLALYRATGEEKYFQAAEKTAQVIVQTRKWPGGGYRHGEKSHELVFLSDSLWMGIAALELYATSGNRSWLKESEETAQFILSRFLPESGGAGFLPVPSNGSALPERPHISENIEAVRYLSLLSRYSGKEEFKRAAEAGMKFLATPETSRGILTEIGIVAADEELSREPAHVTVVGKKADSASQALFKAAIQLPAPYLRSEWWDKLEGPMPNPDVQYPGLARAAAFVCAARRCSLPIFSPAEIALRLKEFESAK